MTLLLIPAWLSVLPLPCTVKDFAGRIDVGRRFPKRGDSRESAKSELLFIKKPMGVPEPSFPVN